MGLVALGALPAVAAVPQEGASRAIPAVYRVEVTLRVDGFAVRPASPGRPRRLMLAPGERTVVRTGTAFAVTPDGVLATSAQLVAPRPADVVQIAGPRALAGRGTATNPAGLRAWSRRATPINARVTRIRLWPAYASGRSPSSAQAIPARVVPRSVADGVALVQAGGAAGAPALGTVRNAGEVALVGFGRATPNTPLEPGVRLGRVAGGLDPGAGPVRPVYAIEAGAGDAGAPLVDADGHVAAMALAEFDAAGCRACVLTAGVDAIAASLHAAGVAPDRGASGRALDDAFAIARTGDVDGATGAYRRAEAAFPSLHDRADVVGVILSRADGAERRGRLAALLWALVALQLAGAGALVWRALRLRPERPGGQPPRRRSSTRSHSR